MILPWSLYFPVFSLTLLSFSYMKRLKIDINLGNDEELSIPGLEEPSVTCGLFSYFISGTENDFLSEKG